MHENFSRFKMKNLILKKYTELKSNIIFYPNILYNADWLKAIPEKKSPHFILTDRKVDSLYGERLERLFRQKELTIKRFVIASGDRSKTLEVYQNLTNKILSAGVNKNSYIMGFGGGVINNIAGLLASTIYRGINLIQIPTTLLAQVDVAIDFKQAINSKFGKNHIGSYYAASKVFIDPSFLETLSSRHIRNGIAEVVKHALTQDKNLLRHLYSQNTKPVFDTNFLEKIIYKTIHLKIILLNDARKSKSLVAEMIPQYGHPVGHALEHLSEYKLLHGEALAIGMCIMAEISHLLSICDDSTRELHYQIIKNYSLPTQIPKWITDRAILNTVKYDKHFIQKIRSILIAKPGKIAQNESGYVFEISTDILRRALILNRSRN